MSFACSQKNAKPVEVTSEVKNIEMFEITALYLPDSIIFKPVEGIEIESSTLTVSFVSKTNPLRTGEITASGELRLTARNGEMVHLLTDKTKLYAKNFNLPADFEPQKIKFVVEEKEIFYNIVEDKWE